MAEMTGSDGGRIEGSMRGLELRHMHLCLAVIVPGIFLWIVYGLLSIPLPRWRSLVGVAVEYLIENLSFLYSMIFAPVLSLVLIGFSLWLLVVAVRRFRGKVTLVLLSLIALLLPALFLLHYSLGLGLFGAVDF